MSTLLQKLFSSKQGRNSVVEYYSQISDVYTGIATHIQMDEQWQHPNELVKFVDKICLEKFVDGLEEPYSSHVGLSQPNSLNQAYQQAMEKANKLARRNGEYELNNTHNQVKINNQAQKIPHNYHFPERSHPAGRIIPQNLPIQNQQQVRFNNYKPTPAAYRPNFQNNSNPIAHRPTYPNNSNPTEQRPSYQPNANTPNQFRNAQTRFPPRIGQSSQMQINRANTDPVIRSNYARQELSYQEVEEPVEDCREEEEYVAEYPLEDYSDPNANVIQETNFHVASDTINLT